MAVAYAKEGVEGPPIADIFYKLIHLGNIHKMKILLPKIRNINEKSHFGVAPLLYAIGQEDNEEMLELLMRHPDIDPLSSDSEKKTALHLFAFKGKFKWVKKFCEKFPDVPVDHLSIWENTPLLEAAEMGHIQIVEYLHQKGADVNAKDDRGYTPLMNSAYWKYPEIFKLLLANGADVSVIGIQGHTAIQLAARSGNFEIVNLLLKHGAPVDGAPIGRPDRDPRFSPKLLELINEKNEKMLEGSLHKLIKLKNVHNLKVLLPQVKDINTKNEMGYSPLLFAVIQENNDALLEFLLQYPGIDPLSSNNERKNALHLFAFKGQLKWIQKFFERFPDMPIDELSVWENTPLMEAAQMGRIEIIEYLLHRGADIHHKNIKQITALHYTAGNGHLEATKRLIELGLDVNAVDNRGYTPLMDSASWNYPEICKVLIGEGASVDAHGPRGHTALYLATLTGAVKVVEVLLEHGANPNGALNLSPMCGAVLKNNVPIIKALIKHKANVNATGVRGQNALCLAAHHSLLKVVKVLLENGADPNLLTNAEIPETSVAAACLGTDVELLKELLKHGGDVNYAGTYSQPLFNCIKADFYEGAVEVINSGTNLRGKHIQDQISPLEYCIKLKRDRIAELIRKHL